MTDEPNFDDIEDEGNPAIKQLRDAYKAIKKERDDFRKIADEAAAERRAKSVADTLQSKDVDPKYARFYTGDDSSPEAVQSWLEENAELVHYAPKTAEQQATEQSASRISDAAATAPPQSLGTLADLEAQIISAKTPEEFRAAKDALMRARVPSNH